MKFDSSGQINNTKKNIKQQQKQQQNNNHNSYYLDFGYRYIGFLAVNVFCFYLNFNCIYEKKQK